MASPENLALQEAMRQAPPLTGGPAEWREAAATGTAHFVVPSTIRRETITANGVDAEWFRHDDAGEGVMLYIHGGGYILCSTVSHQALIGDLAVAAKVNALGINYRLAPEHPFPAAVEDVIASYRFLLEAGHEPSKIALVGDSAGGGLAAALLLSNRQHGFPQPACAVLMSPWLDMSLSLPAMEGRAHLDPICSAEILTVMANAYLAGHDPRDPLVSPLFGEWDGVPPVFILVGGHEVLLDDSIAFARKLEGVGADVSLEVAEECIHVYPMYSQVHPEGAEAIEQAAAFIRGKLQS